MKGNSNTSQCLHVETKLYYTPHFISLFLIFTQAISEDMDKEFSILNGFQRHSGAGNAEGTGAGEGLLSWGTLGDSSTEAFDQSQSDHLRGISD